MKHIFIINPKSGKDEAKAELLEKLKALDGSIEYEVYTTTGELDATRYVKARCEGAKEPMRFYACGGDGTFNEVVSGAVGHPEAQVAVYPCGSGNDFVKYYGGPAAFLDLERLVNGEVRRIDVMRIGDRYSVNVCNFGFDSCVASTMMRVRRSKVFGGKNAYTTGIVVALLKAMRNACEIKVDGEYVHRGDLLLCTIANGQYVGGSFCCAPRSSNDDGLLEVCVVKPISRMKFIKLLDPYTKGQHLDDPEFKDIIVYCRGKEIEVDAPDGFLVSLDGEMVENSHLRIKLLEKAVAFVAPRGV